MGPRLERAVLVGITLDGIVGEEKGARARYVAQVVRRVIVAKGLARKRREDARTDGRYERKEDEEHGW